MMNAIDLTDLDVAAFKRDGFLVRKGLATSDTCRTLREISSSHLQQQMAPVEYEVDVHYPGAPQSFDKEGGQTSRRLLQAYSRHDDFRRWATSPEVAATLRQLFGAQGIELSQCHHNCVMTKQPGYSSVTLWHQDNRYWSFDEENLISVWLALGDESKENGCLRVIPGSHLMEIEPGRFDAAKFLRPDLEANKKLLGQAQLVGLEQGDVLFFHSRLFHAAGRNLSDVTKYSVVFTYHESGNRPIADTRSARFPSIVL